VFRTILGWNGDLGYIVRVHGQEINSFRRKTRSKALHEFKLHRQEKFLYVCDTLHMWEWDVRVLDRGGRLPKRRRGRTTPAGPDDRAAGTGDGNAWHEFDRERSVVGRRAGFCSRPTGARRVGATTYLSTLPQAVHDQGLRQHPVSTVFGLVEVPNPRWNRCGCQAEGPQTFRPMRTWLNEQTSPEMLYLETKWASLIPFARATDLLKEVLPVGDLVNAESVRNHLQLTAERIEQELGEERQLDRFEGSEQEWERQPLPDGPITVGIDGGYVARRISRDGSR
jgi:hypothetical protein